MYRLCLPPNISHADGHAGKASSAHLVMVLVFLLAGDSLLVMGQGCHVVAYKLELLGIHLGDGRDLGPLQLQRTVPVQQVATHLKAK